MVSEIMNLQLGIYHLRPLNDKWSVRAAVGMGVFTPSTDFSRIRFKNVLGSAGVVFIRHLKPNLAVGGRLGSEQLPGLSDAISCRVFELETPG
jgi:hypothetical protein